MVDADLAKKLKPSRCTDLSGNAKPKIAKGAVFVIGVIEEPWILVRKRCRHFGPDHHSAITDADRFGGQALCVSGRKTTQRNQDRDHEGSVHST